MVPPSSHRVSRVRRYSGSGWLLRPFAYEALTPSGVSSHTLRLKLRIPSAVLTPQVLLPMVWPLPLSLATTRRISFDVFSSPYLDVSVQAVPPICLCIQHMVTGLDSGRVSPFGHPRVICLLSANRGFSQIAAPFFGSQCQGIPLALFLA